MRQNGIWLMFSDPSKQVPCSTWLGGGFKPFFFFKLSPPKNWGIWCFSHFDVQNVRMVGSTTTQIMYTKGQKGEKMFTVGHDLCLLHLVIRYGRGLHVTQQYTPHIHIHIYIYIFTHLWLINDVRDLPTETTSTVYFVEAPGIWYNKDQSSIFCNQDPHNQIS